MLICGGPDSHDRVRKHLHKLVYAAIVIITAVWSPVSAKEKNISFNPIDTSAKALASPIIGHRGHPRRSWAAAFLCRKMYWAHPSSLVSRQKLLALGWNATRDVLNGPPRPPGVQGGSRSFGRFLKWLPLISLMASVPAETDKRSHSANVFFVHSVGKGCDRRFRRLQTSEEGWPCRMTSPLICVVWAFYFILFFFMRVYTALIHTI